MAPRPGHNSLPGNKPAPSTEPFKQSVSGTMRAISGEPELEVIFSGDRPGLSGMSARLPEPSRKINAREIAITRGLSDSIALRIACHDKAVHSKNMPQGPDARAIFEAVEQARCEAVGARRMQGVADNLSVMLDDRFRKSGAPDISSREEAPLQDALSLLVRERLTGAKPPESATKLVDMWRGWIEDKAGADLDRLEAEVEDQNSFAARLRDVLKSLDMGDELGDHDQDMDPEENEDQGNNDEAESGDDSEEDSGEQEASPQEMELSGEEQESGDTEAAEAIWKTSPIRTCRRIPRNRVKATGQIRRFPTGRNPTTACSPPSLTRRLPLKNFATWRSLIVCAGSWTSS